jgi:hypothetical protein
MVAIFMTYLKNTNLQHNFLNWPGVYAAGEARRTT